MRYEWKQDHARRVLNAFIKGEMVDSLSTESLEGFH